MALREDAFAIFQAALAAVDPEVATRRALRRLKLRFDEFDGIYLVAVGKAATRMAFAVESVLGGRLTGGIVLTKRGHADIGLRCCQILEASHPIPDLDGARASESIEELVRGLGKRDLLIMAISGGASALLSAPAEGITLADKQQTTDLLLRAGADIFELNTVRKHLSRLKGGQLAALAYPATVVSLLLSDVIGDQIDVIGSGPTAPDPSTLADARNVLKKYSLADRVPAAVGQRLRSRKAETPKASDPIFKKVRNVVTASNRQALAAAAVKARALGYRPLILSSSIQGEAREAARVHASLLRDASSGACLLTGGETTVTVTGHGKGGRNQEFALALAIDIACVPNVAALCAGTDGTDGPTDAAGGFVDGNTVNDKVQARSYLKDNNSYEYLNSRQALVKTGPTGTNVMDINILLSAQKK